MPTRNPLSLALIALVLGATHAHVRNLFVPFASKAASASTGRSARRGQFINGFRLVEEQA